MYHENVSDLDALPQSHHGRCIIVVYRSFSITLCNIFKVIDCKPYSDCSFWKCTPKLTKPYLGFDSLVRIFAFCQYQIFFVEFWFCMALSRKILGISQYNFQTKCFSKPHKKISKPAFLSFGVLFLHNFFFTFSAMYEENFIEKFQIAI